MLDENRPGRDYFRERLGSDDIVTSSDDDMMVVSEGENDKEEKISSEQPTKLLALREVTNDNNEKNIQVSCKSVDAKSSIKFANLSEEEILRLQSP